MTIRKFSQVKEILRFEGATPFAYWKRFAALLTLSVTMAAMGLLRDSGAVVIAAMLIAPLMTPILGIAAAMVMGWHARMLKLLVGVVVAATYCIALSWLMVWIADVPKGIIVPGEVMARTDPGIEELIVALAAGAAGAYVQIQRQEISLLPGAAIGVSLVPPLSASGILVYFADYLRAWEAALLFLTNLTAIVLSACAVYIISSVRASILRRSKRAFRFSTSFFVLVVATLIIVVRLGEATVERFKESRLEATLTEEIADWANTVSVEIVRLDVDLDRARGDLWLILDLPISGLNSTQSISDQIPERLNEVPLRAIVAEVLGDDFSVAIRVQTRFAGLLNNETGLVMPAPPVETGTEP
ncbi:MAG: DUF389 domain-containing protein [Pseudomonadota bacterium]